MNTKETVSQVLLEVGVKVFLMNKDNQYLILKRATPYPRQKIKKWDIPGGRINPGEPLISALKRELFEETGLKLKKVNQILTVQDILWTPNKHIVRITYLAYWPNSTKVTIDPDEHCAYQWTSLKEFQKLRHDIYLKEALNKLTAENVPLHFYKNRV